jgi:hypothetical protein
MMKKLTFKFLFTVLFIVLFNSISAQILQVNNEEAKKMVEVTMKPFLKAIPIDMLPYYNISDTNEINKAVIENPIPVYYLDHDSLQFSNTWRVPLIINDEYRALFTVLFSNEAYSIVDFGAAVLAEDIQKYTKETSIFGILRVFSIHKDYFIIKNEKNEQMFEPIPVYNNQKVTLSEILKLIH